MVLWVGSPSLVEMLVTSDTLSRVTLSGQCVMAIHSSLSMVQRKATSSSLDWACTAAFPVRQSNRPNHRAVRIYSPIGATGLPLLAAFRTTRKEEKSCTCAEISYFQI